MVYIKKVTLMILFIFISFIGEETVALPPQFVYLEEIDPSIFQDIKYYGNDNFLGRPVKGYEAPRCILTENAALALKKIQSQIKSDQWSLKVYDCYRPQMAVNDFIVWSKNIHDQKMKQQHYPRVDKKDFFKLGYVAEKSSHTRGSTVDLTIVKISDSGKILEKLDMGTPFDYMDELSHPLNKNVDPKVYENRMILRKLMQDAGFVPLETEWWHFTLSDEPFPDTYFNFPVNLSSGFLREA